MEIVFIVLGIVGLAGWWIKGLYSNRVRHANNEAEAVQNAYDEIEIADDLLLDPDYRQRLYDSDNQSS